MGNSGKIIRLLMFGLDDRNFAIPLAQVQRVIRAVEPTHVPQAPEIVLGVIDFHGTILPVLNIRARFGCVNREMGVEDQFIIAVTSKRTVALAVDIAKGIVERPAEDIVVAAELVDRSDQIDGVAHLNDELVLIHDLERFLSPTEELTLEDAVTRQARYGN
jgi:purine-binding chemotaxis protein CheW